MPARVEIRGTGDFRRTAAKLKAAGNGQLTRKMRKEMADAAEPAVDEAKRNVMALDVEGARGGGGQQRREHDISRARSASGRAKQRATGGRGLRATVARAVKLQVLSKGRNAGVRIKVMLSQMPRDQRELPFYLNEGRWRHPTFGRHGWVTQFARPAGFFDRAMRRKGAKARTGARTAVRDTIRKIAA